MRATEPRTPPAPRCAACPPERRAQLEFSVSVEGERADAERAVDAIAVAVERVRRRFPHLRFGTLRDDVTYER